VAIILDSVKVRAMKDESGRPTDILLNLIVFSVEMVWYGGIVFWIWNHNVVSDNNDFTNIVNLKRGCDMFMRAFANCICLLAMATLLSGCTTGFQQPEADANYGSLPVNYELTIKKYFDEVLIDAESANYIFSQPIETYENEGLLAGGEAL
jgi:hypothetical protein